MNLILEHVEYGTFYSRERVVHKKTLPFLILVHTKMGAYHVKIGGKKWVVSRGESFVVPPNVEVEFEHVPEPQMSMESIWAHLTTVAYQAYEWADFFQLPARIQGKVSLEIGKALKAGQSVSSDWSLAGQAAKAARAYDLLSILNSVVTR